MRAATGAALLPPHAREVAAAIADHGRAIGGKPCPDQFTILPLFDPLACVGVDALDQEGIRPGVHAIAGFAFTGHARAEELRHTEFVVCCDVEEFFELHARFPGPGFRAEQADLQLRLSEIDAALTSLATNIKADGGRHTHSGHTKINDEVDHAIILASIGTHWNGHRVHCHRPVVETEASSCQTIAVAVHENIAGAHAGHPQFARIEIRPVIDVLLGREDRHAFAGGTTGGMNLNGTTLVTWFLKGHTIGIGFAHGFLFEERQLLNVL